MIERRPGVPFQKIQFGTDRAAGVLFYLTPGAAHRENLGPLRSLILCPLSVAGFFLLGSGPRLKSSETPRALASRDSSVNYILASIF